MKKLFAWVLLLTLMLGLFAGCKKTETPTEPSLGDYVTAEAAMEYLKALYKTTEEATPTPRDYERYGVIRVGGEPFEITWTVDVDSIKVVPGEDEMVTIDIDEQCQTETPYVLTATITDKGGNSVSHSWNYIMPVAMDVGQILKDAYALADGESLPYEVTLTGKIIMINDMYDPDYNNITVTMVVEGYEEYPIECYRLKGDGIDQLNFGNIITVTGTIKNYKGTIEFDSGCILESWEKGDAVDAPTDPLQIVKDAYALANDEFLPYIATLTGKVTEIDTPFDPEYNNISIVMTVEGAENMPITCYRLKGVGVDQIAVDDIVTVMGIIKNYKGTIEFDAGCRLMDRISGGREAEKPSSDPAKIFADAKKLKSGEHLNYYATLTGKVTDIESPYDKEYNNITVVISVKGYEGTPITCYRLKGNGVEKIARGDTITVKGIIENYKGKLEFGSGCTLLDRVSGGGVAKPETSNVKTIMTDAAKLKSGQHLDYYSTLTGKVIDIESPYDKEYQNITVVMEVKGYENMPITCYRLKSGAYNVSKIARGDTITVRGVLENYNGKLEYGSGCTLQKRVSGGGTVKPETSNVKTIMADAAKLQSGDHLDYYSTLTGKVIDIESPYDKEYGNITVVMEVKGYENMPITCYRLKSGAYNVSKIARGDTITVRGVLENYNGKLEYGSGCTLQKRVSGGGTVKPETSDVKTIMTDAAKLQSGDHLDYYSTLTGKVIDIESPYDKEYGNITVVMEVKGYENMPITCYRLKSGAYNVSKIARGDTITVRGVLENYNGKLEYGSGCTLQKRVSGGGVAKPESSDAKAILADAAKLADGESLSYYANLTGKVTKIDTPYDKEYGNISVVIDVNGTELLCYRLKSGAADVSKIAVGDTITVRGVIENYKGDIQFGTGSTLTNRVSGGGVAKPESSDAKAILDDATKLAEGEKLTYYANLTGKVTKIDTPYDKEYGNISVYITVEVEGYPAYTLLCYRLKGAEGQDVSKIAVNDTITVRGVLTNYKGNVQFDSGSTMTSHISGGGKVQQWESTDTAQIMADAAQLADRENLLYFSTLTGKVTKIEYPYDSKTDKITAVMVVEGYESMPITCYGLQSGDADASKVAVGDTITVRGLLMNYNGTIEFGSGCKLKARTSGGGTVEPESSDQTQILADAQALASGEALDYLATLTGKVTEIKEAYSTEHENITFYMNVNGTSIQCYRLVSGDADASLIAVGDTVTVRGLIKKYRTTLEFVQGCTLEARIPGTGSGDDNTDDTTYGFVDAPEANTAYKFGVYLPPENNTNYYITGSMSGFYFATTDNASSAVDVYLESVSNGYVLYFMDGSTKTYVNIALRDGYTNQANPVFVTEGSGEATVYKLNTENRYIYTTIGAESFYLGTYTNSSGKTFTTLSASNASYISDTGKIGTTQFPAWFMAEGLTNDSDTPPAGGDIEIPEGSVKIDFGDVNNRVSYSTQQQVWQQNGITVTNDKAGSSSNVYNNTSSNDYARFYKSSKLTVEYPGMTRLIFTHTSPYNDTEYVNGLTKALEGRSDVVVTRNDLIVQIDFVAPVDKFVIESLVYQIRVHDITACTGTTPPEGGGNVGGGTGGDQVTGNTPVDTPVAGTAYKWAIDQANKGVTLYFAGTMDGFYGASTQNVNDAVDVVLEETTGGYYLSFTVSGTTKYVNIVNAIGNDGNPHTNFIIDDTPETVYTYNTEHKTLVTVLNGTDYYIGTFGNYSTFSASELEKISTSFPAYFCTPGGDGGLNGGGSTGGDTTTTNKVATVVIYNPANGKALSSNPSRDGSYYLGGVDVTVDGNTVTGYGETEQWDLIDNGNGTYSFAYNGQNLAMGASYSSTPLGEVNDDWKVTDAGNGLYLLENTVRTGFKMQWRAGDDYNYFSAYNYGDDGAGYQFAFHVISGTLPTFGEVTGGGNTGNEGGNAPSTGSTVAKVVIYNPSVGKALSSNPSRDGSYYLGGVDVTVDGNTVTGYGETEQWDLIDNGNGTYSFAYNGQNLAMGASYSSTPLGEVNDDWKVTDAGNGLYLLENTVRTGFKMQWRAGDDYNYFSAYNYGDDGAGYQFAFHVISGTLPTFGEVTGGGNTGNEGGNAPSTGSTVAKVVIYNPSVGKALSSNPSRDGSYYLGGVDVTVDGNTVTGYGETEQWDLIDNGNGTYSFAYNGQNLAMGASYSSTPLGEVNDDWKVTDAGNGLYLLENTVRTGFKMQWRAGDDYNYFSAYNYGDDGAGYQFAFHVISGTLPTFGEVTGGGNTGNEDDNTPAASTTYTFANYAAGNQYAENEVHQLDSVITVTSNKAHFTSELRMYNSTSNDATAVIASTKTITKIVLNAGYKSGAKMLIYGSNDGESYEQVGTFTTTSTSYSDYQIELGEGYKYLKLDVESPTNSNGQIRIKYMTVTFEE